METTDKTIIQCKRIFNHPVQKVFAAFLNPASVKQWFGPKEFSIGQVEIEPRVGGRVWIEMISPKGDKLIAKGKYTDIIQGEKIAYLFAYEPDMPGIGENLVSFYFTETNGQTEVALVQEIYKTINAQGRTKGWEDGFDKLELLLQN